MKLTSLILFVGFIMRILIGFYVQFNGIENSLDGDVLNFYEQMRIVSLTGHYFEFQIGQNQLVNSFGILMYLFGSEPIIPCLISCAIWYISAIFFSKSLNLINCSETTKIYMAIAFILWPTAVYYTAIPLRESTQLMFITVAAYGALQAIARKNAGYLFFTVLGVVGAGSLHGALLAYGTFAAAASTFYYFANGRQIRVTTLIVGGVAASLVAWAGISLFSALSYDLSNGAVISLTSYQEGGLVLISRADYRTQAYDSGALGFILSIVSGFFQYMMEPLPTRIGSLSDIILAVENIARILVLTMAIFKLSKSQTAEGASLLLFLLLLYVALEVIWSVGTINWGTASRHHAPGLSLLLLIAAQAWAIPSSSKKTSQAMVSRLR